SKARINAAIEPFTSKVAGASSRVLAISILLINILAPAAIICASEAPSQARFFGPAWLRLNDHWHSISECVCILNCELVMERQENVVSVIVGAGEIKDRPAGLMLAIEPAALMAEALMRAEQDAGANLLARLDSLYVINELSWPYLNPCAEVA